MINKPRMRADHSKSLCAAALAVVMAFSVTHSASAMPIETDSYTDIPGATEDGQLDIREVLDNSTEMDIRLTKQIMLLQRQINQLQRKIEKLEAAQAQ